MIYLTPQYVDYKFIFSYFLYPKDDAFTVVRATKLVIKIIGYDPIATEKS
jgi:hypothetical protein